MAEQRLPATEDVPLTHEAGASSGSAGAERNIARTLEYFSRAVGEIVVKAAAEIDAALRQAGAELGRPLAALAPQPVIPPLKLQPRAAVSTPQPVTMPKPLEASPAPASPESIRITGQARKIYDTIVILTEGGRTPFTGIITVPGVEPGEMNSYLRRLEARGLVSFERVGNGRRAQLLKTLDGKDIAPPLPALKHGDIVRVAGFPGIPDGKRRFVDGVVSELVPVTDADWLERQPNPLRAAPPAGRPHTPALPSKPDSRKAINADAAAPTPKETCPGPEPATPIAETAPAKTSLVERAEAVSAGSELEETGSSGPAFARGQPRATKGAAPWLRRTPIKPPAPHLPVRPQDLAASRSVFLKLAPIAPQLMVQGDETPALAGPAGRAWRHRAPPYRACDRARLGTWIVDLWPSKPAWSVYALSLAHLRDIGAEDLSICKPTIRAEGATHELVLVQVDARHPVDLDQPIFWLEPFVFERQFFASSDAAALAVAEASLRDICLSGLIGKNGADGIPFLHRFTIAAAAAGASR